MQFVAGEVGSHCQMVVTFFILVSPYQTRDNVVPQFISAPDQPPLISTTSSATVIYRETSNVAELLYYMVNGL